MGKQEIDTEKMIVSIYNDQQRLVKHFGLDRFSKNDGKDDEVSNKLLENIVEKLDILSAQKSFSGEQQAMLNKMAGSITETVTKLQAEQSGEFLTALEGVQNKLSELQANTENSIIKHHHTHIVDLKNSKTVVVIVAMGLAILVSLYFNVRQIEKNNVLRDNDLKYRYVRMHCKSTAEELNRLENIFTFNRNEDSVRIIRWQVEHYEQLQKEYNEKQLQIRLNDERARQIEQEAQTVKGRK